MDLKAPKNLTPEELQAQVQKHIEDIKKIKEQAETFQKMISNPEEVKKLSTENLKKLHKQFTEQVDKAFKLQVQAYNYQVAALQESTKSSLIEATKANQELEKEVVRKATLNQAPEGTTIKSTTDASDYKFKTKYPQDLTPEDYKAQVKAKKEAIEAELASKDPFDKTNIEAKKKAEKEAKANFEKLQAEFEAKRAGSVQDQNTVKDPARSLMTSAGGKIASYKPHIPNNNLGMKFTR